MSKKGRTSAHSGLLALAVLLRIGLFIADHFAPVLTFELRPQDITSSTAGLYTVPVKPTRSWWWHTLGDSSEAPLNSTLVLREGNRALEPPHAPHAEIPNGGGRYSHWGDWLYFSTSDGSDPRVNGRSYRAEMRPTVAPVLIMASNALLAIGLLSTVMLGWRKAFRKRRAANPRETAIQAANVLLTTNLFGETSSAARRRAVAASACLLGLLMALATFAPERLVHITAAEVQSGDGYMRHVALDVPMHFPYCILSDSTNAPHASSLKLYEDGRELEPGHAEHSVIESKGTGRYSHWNGHLHFSSSDGSEPADGIHQYMASVKSALIPGLLPAALLLFAATAILAWPFEASRIAHFALYPVPAMPAWVKGTIVLIAAALSCALMIWIWMARPGAAPAPSIAGYLPLSDALGYNTCATRIAMLGHFVGDFEHYEFCGRRTLYPSLLAFFHLMTRSQIATILLLQAGIVGAAIGFLAARISRVLCPLAAIFIATVLCVYTMQYVLGLFMTEFAGFVFGTLALSFLIDDGNRAFRPRFLIGCALMSVALISRNGAMLVLPALLAWAILEQARAGIGRLAQIGMITAAVLAFGLLIQRAILEINGIGAASSFNNFATVLYRLSIGAKDWTQAMIDYPKLPNERDLEQFARIYDHALLNILSNPIVFLRALGRGFIIYVNTLYDFVGAPSLARLLNIFTVLGLIGCALGWRQRACQLTLLMFAGELLSAPLIVEDGGMRVFAATIAIRIVFASVGLVLLCMIVASAAKLVPSALERFARPFDERKVLHRQHGEFVLASLLVVMMLLPYVEAFSEPLRPAPLYSTGCPRGLWEAVVDIRHESFSIGLTDRPPQSVFEKPVLMSKQRMLNSVRSSWYEADIAALPDHALLIQAFDRAPERYAQALRLLIEDNRRLLGLSGPHTLCFDPSQGPIIGNVPYRRIEQIGTAASRGP